MRELFNRCARVEKVVAEIYRHLAQRETYSEELRLIFRGLARDEEDHARQLGHALELPEGTLSARPWQDQIDHLQEKAQGALEAIRLQSIPEAEAIRLAGWLEKDFRQVHLTASALFPTEELKGLFDLLAGSEDEHLARLRLYQAR